MTDNNSLVTNASLQADEVKAMESIYGDDWRQLNPSDGIFAIVIGDESSDRLHLQVSFPPSYPLESSPKFHFISSWVSDSLKEKLNSNIDTICQKHSGESVMIVLVEKLRGILQNFRKDPAKKNEIKKAGVEGTANKRSMACKEEGEQLTIMHSETITMRKSIFQAHLCAVKSLKQVKQVLSKLKENRKIATAKHNIVAYRFYDENKGVLIQDFDEDGEHKAGPPLLHLLQILDVQNVVVVVTRWYGGIQLGPDRFRLIVRAARSVLDKNGYIKNLPTSTSTKETLEE